MPFVGQTPDGRCYWQVSPTRNFDEDHATGQAYGLMMLDFLRDGCDPRLLSATLTDMLLVECPSAIEFGFMHVIAEAALQAELGTRRGGPLGRYPLLARTVH